MRTDTSKNVKDALRRRKPKANGHWTVTVSIFWFYVL